MKFYKPKKQLVAMKARPAEMAKGQNKTAQGKGVPPRKGKAPVLSAIDLRFIDSPKTLHASFKKTQGT